MKARSKTLRTDAVNNTAKMKKATNIQKTTSTLAHIASYGSMHLKRSIGYLVYDLPKPTAKKLS